MAHINSGGQNQVPYTLENDAICPTTVDKTNWLSDETYGDTFSVTQNGRDLVVQRTDANGGWGLPLKFCCTYFLLISLHFLTPTTCNKLHELQKSEK